MCRSDASGCVGAQKRVVRKTEEITPENAVIKIMCNKKAAWQSKAHS